MIGVLSFDDVCGVRVEDVDAAAVAPDDQAVLSVSADGADAGPRRKGDVTGQWLEGFGQNTS